MTYLFYELQRRYTIREFLYQIQPVIMIAQDVPSPEQINESWLIQYQWILARVLLDDSLKPALTYLSMGDAGDQLSTAVLQAQWKTQESLVQQLETLVEQQMVSRDSLQHDPGESRRARFSSRDTWHAEFVEFLAIPPMWRGRRSKPKPRLERRD